MNEHDAHVRWFRVVTLGLYSTAIFNLNYSLCVKRSFLCLSLLPSRSTRCALLYCRVVGVGNRFESCYIFLLCLSLRNTAGLVLLRYSLDTNFINLTKFIYMHRDSEIEGETLHRAKSAETSK